MPVYLIVGMKKGDKKNPQKKFPQKDVGNIKDFSKRIFTTLLVSMFFSIPILTKCGTNKQFFGGNGRMDSHKNLQEGTFYVACCLRDLPDDLS